MFHSKNKKSSAAKFLVLITLAGIAAVGIFLNTVSRSAFKDTPDSSAAEEITLDFISALTTGKVIRVKDGDTYVLNIDGEETTVRLIGVDTPESVAPPDYSKENTSDGRTVSEIVKQVIRPGDTLYIEYDVSPTDKYGRTLAYLYFENGEMVQEWLLANGYARVMTVQPNSKYAEKFAEIQHKALENKIGLWNGYFDGE